MQIKVKDTRMHTTKVMGHDYDSITVVEGKLVLVKCEPEEAILWQHYFTLDSPPGEIYLHDYSEDGLVRGMGKYLKPIIISETEKIEPGVDYMFAHGQIQEPDKTYREITGSTKKILALPEHFSSKHLQAIVDGKMKYEDKVLIECEPYGIDKGEIDFKYSIKLNSSNHITLHKIEEKKYTREEVYKLCWNIFTLSYSGYINSNLGEYPEGKERKEVEKKFDIWFKQNVK